MVQSVGSRWQSSGDHDHEQSSLVFVASIIATFRVAGRRRTRRKSHGGEDMKLAHDRPATLFLPGVHFLSGDSRPVSSLSLGSRLFVV